MYDSTGNVSQGKEEENSKSWDAVELLKAAGEGNTEQFAKQVATIFDALQEKQFPTDQMSYALRDLTQAFRASPSEQIKRVCQYKINQLEDQRQMDFDKMVRIHTTGETSD